MKRLATLLLAVVLALGLSLSVLTASGAPPTMTLDHGHVDAFYVTPDGEGGIDLRLKEDVTGNGVVHRPEDVLLRVSPAALVDIPDSKGGLTSFAQAQVRLKPAVVRPIIANSEYDSHSGMVRPDNQSSQSAA